MDTIKPLQLAMDSLDEHDSVCFDELEDMAVVDAAQLAVDDDGILRFTARTARTGVQQYVLKDGSLERRYRPPEEVFAPDSMATWAQRAITVDHPPQLISPTNAKKHMVGMSGEKPWRDGQVLMQRLAVADAAAIDEVLSGRRRQISNGYLYRLDRTPGISPEGEAYDAVMRNIRGNHIALVSKARGGPSLAPVLDSADAGAVADDSRIDPQLTKPEVNRMARMKLNGADREVPDALVDAIQAELQLQARDSAEKLNQANGKAAGLEAKVAQLETDVRAAKDAAPNLDAIRAQVKARSELEADAAKHGVAVDAKDTDDALRRKVIAKIAPTVALDGKDEGFVTGVYAALATTVAKDQAPAASFASAARQSAIAGDQVKTATDSAPQTIEALDRDSRLAMTLSHTKPLPGAAVRS